MVVAAMDGVTPARRAGRSSCDDPHRWVAAAQCVGADAETDGDNVEPKLPVLQLAVDEPAARGAPVRPSTAAGPAH